jgi:hypothetical protein
VCRPQEGSLWCAVIYMYVCACVLACVCVCVCVCVCLCVCVCVTGGGTVVSCDIQAMALEKCQALLSRCPPQPHSSILTPPLLPPSLTLSPHVHVRAFIPEKAALHTHIHTTHHYSFISVRTSIIQQMN